MCWAGLGWRGGRRKDGARGWRITRGRGVGDGRIGIGTGGEEAFSTALRSRVGSFAFGRCNVGFLFCQCEELGWLTSTSRARVYVGYVHCTTSPFLGHMCLITSHASKQASKQACICAVYSFCSRVSINCTHTTTSPIPQSPPSTHPPIQTHLPPTPKHSKTNHHSPLQTPPPTYPPAACSASPSTQQAPRCSTRQSHHRRPTRDSSPAQRHAHAQSTRSKAPRACWKPTRRCRPRRPCCRS